jgi:hypothetical protein
LLIRLRWETWGDSLAWWIRLGLEVLRVAGNRQRGGKPQGEARFEE